MPDGSVKYGLYKDWETIGFFPTADDAKKACEAKKRV